MNNIHGARFNRDALEPKGSGFVGKHAADFLFANDAWSQVISLKTGPDGQVYFIDWYDRQQCHHVGTNIHDRPTAGSSSSPTAPQTPASTSTSRRPRS